MRARLLAAALLLLGVVCLGQQARSQLTLQNVGGGFGAGGTSCSQGNTVVARLTGPPSAGVQQAYQNFVCGLVSNSLASGNFTATCGSIFDVIMIYWSDTATNAGKMICNTNFTPNNVSLTFTSLRGWSGGGTAAQYFDTGYNPSTAAANYTLSSAHISCYMIAGTATNTACMSANGLTGINIYPHLSGPNSYFRINDSPESGGQTDQGTQVGYWVANRTACGGSPLSAGYYNGSAVNTTINETCQGALDNADIIVMNTNSTSAGSNTGTVGAITIGAQLTGGQISTLNTLLQAFCHDPSIGAC